MFYKALNCINDYHVYSCFSEPERVLCFRLSQSHEPTDYLNPDQVPSKKVFIKDQNYLFPLKSCDFLNVM